MAGQIVRAAMTLALCLTVSVALGQPRGKGAEKNRGNERPKANEKGREGEKPGNKGMPGNKAPGGAWSEGKTPAGHDPAAEKRKNAPASGTEGAASRLKSQPATAKPGAAAASGLKNPNAGNAAGAAAAANRNNPNLAEDDRYAAVRDSFDHPNVYNREWYDAHEGAWTANRWAMGTAWTATNMAEIASFSGLNSRPVNYGYGNNVTYQNGNVMVDGQNVGTGEEFSQQAAALAQAGLDAKPADSDDWKPLGVFALVRDESQQPQLTVQLAINQAGILAGNYTDLISDHTQPIHGSVDKETQRAAWTIGDNKYVFLEAGLKNLTDGEAPALMHKYSKTEKWLLVRLPQPQSEADTGTAPPAAQ